MGIAVTDDEVFVSDSRNTRIQVFDLDGNFKRMFGEEGEAPGQFSRPMNLTIANSELYVADYFNDRIQVYGLDGVFRRGIGGKVVNVIDTKSLKLVKQIEVGAAPHGVRSSADSHWVYTAVTGTGKIVVINTRTLKVEKHVDAPGKAPFWIAVRGNT